MYNTLQVVKHIVCTALAVVMIPLGSMAQDGALRRAEKSFDEYSYADAIEHYEKAFDKGATDVNAKRKLAESYRKIRDFKNAEIWFEQVVSSGEATGVDIYCYAEALRANAQYEQADMIMERYAKQVGDDSRSKRQGNSMETVPYLLIDPLFEGEVTPLKGNSEYSDMSPVIIDDRLIFASARNEDVSTRRSHSWDGQPFLDLYESKLIIDGTLENVKGLKGKVNTRYHESDPTFSSDGLEMYFTRNSYYEGKSSLSETGVNNLQIFYATFQNGEWTNEKAFEYNNDQYSIGHPSLSADGQKLYLASEMPGGHGGTDIYVCERKRDGSWSEPKNLGPEINTEGNEIFPTSFKNNVLFFTSDGQLGLGGLDIYMAEMEDDGIMITNLGAPVNSMHDDFSITLDPSGEFGYFTSDRPGGVGSDDIYRFDLDRAYKRRVTISGVVLDSIDRSPMPNVPVTLIRPDGSELATVLTDANGEYHIKTRPADVEVIAHIPNGQKKRMTFSATKLDELGGVDADFELSALFDLAVWAHISNAKDGTPLEGVEVIMTDILNDGSTLYRALTDGSGDVRTLFEEMKLHQMIGYRVFIAKKGFFPKELDLEMTIEGYEEVALHERLRIALDPIELGAELSKALSLHHIYFDYDSYTIRQDAKKQLNIVAWTLKSYPELSIELGSHTDSRASAGYNNKLSQQRAESSRKWLLDQGIEARRIKARGYGESKLINDCGDDSDCSEEFHQLNRRTEFVVIGIEK